MKGKWERMKGKEGCFLDSLRIQADSNKKMAYVVKMFLDDVHSWFIRRLSRKISWGASKVDSDIHGLSRTL